MIEEKTVVPAILKPKAKASDRPAITILVDFGDKSFEFNYRTNMLTSLMAPQRSEEALNERFVRIIKENFGLAR